MKQGFINFFILIILSLWQGFLNAQISADISSGCAPLTVNFTPPAGMSTYYWDFDNGGSSTDANPTGVIFNTPKNPYTVTLRACKTCPVLHTYNITVFPKPTITIDPITGCAPLNASISPIINLPPGVSTTSIKYIYSDGTSITKTAPNTSPDVHLFQVGQHDITFDITTSPTNAGCNTLKTISSCVKLSNLFIGITSSLSSGCSAPLTVNYTANVVADRPIVSYEWDFGGGNKASTANASYTFTSIGSHTVTLKVKDDYGCERTVSKTIIIQENDLTKIIANDTVCINSVLNVGHDGNPTLVNTAWSFPGASGAGNTNSFQATVVYSSVGLKTYSVTTNIGGKCFKTVSKQVMVIDPKFNLTIVPKPLCNRTNTFTLICNDSNFYSSIEWKLISPDDTYNLVVSKKFNETITLTQDDLDTIQWKYRRLYLSVYAVSKYGCDKTFLDTNFISPIIAHVVPTKTQGCIPLTIGFYDKTTRYRKDTLVEWKLDFGDGTSTIVVPPFDTVYHTYTTRGLYDMRMIAKNKHGCLDTTYVTKIKAGDTMTPDFTISPSGPFCASSSNTITLQSLVPNSLGQVTKFWCDGFQCYTTNSLTFRPKKTAGLVNIKMEVADNGCFSKVVKSITTKGPIARFNYIQNCDSLKKVVFNNISQDANKYLWNFGDGKTDTSANPSHTYLADGYYKVLLTSQNTTNGCPQDTYSMRIQIQTPVAKFNKDSFVFCTNDLTKFISAKPSSGYIKDNLNSGFIWEFASLKTPFRTYTDSFDYASNFPIIDTVYLTVRNFMNCTHTAKVPVKIDEITANPTIVPKIICTGDTVIFNANDTSYFPRTIKNWTFGDTKNAQKSIDSHVYIFPKNSNDFPVQYTVTNSIGCTYSFFDVVQIKRLNLSFSSVKNLCISSVSNVLTAFSNPSYILNYKWKLPDGSSAIGKSVNYSFPAQAKYPFEIYAVEVSNSRCVDTVKDTVFAWNRPDLKITSNKDALGTLCDPLSLDVTFSDLNNTAIIPSSIKWELNNSAGIKNFYVPSVSSALTKGVNKYTIIASNVYCADTTVRLFDVKAPSGIIDIDKNDICIGSEITFTVKNLIDVTDYSIDFGDGFSSINTSPITHKYTYVPIGGKTKAKVIFATNGNECVGPPVDTTIRIYEIFAKFGINYNGDSSFCKKPVPIKDSSKGANIYRWSFGDGSSGSMAEPGLRNYAKADTYLIKLNIENSTYGCKDSFQKFVILFPLPQVKLKNDTSCLGDTSKVYSLIKQPFTSYSWKPSNLFLKPSPTDTNRILIDTTTKITLIARDSSSKCSDSISSDLYIVKPIQPTKLDTIIAPGADVLLPYDLIPNYSSLWNPDSFLSCLNCKNPIAQYILNPIRYKVYYRDELKNCFNDSSIYNIRIFPDILVNAPTAFTPNGDGNNDIFYARGFGIKKLLSFKIYNRWGQLLFFSTSEFNGWDGYYKDVPQNSEMYFYTIQGESYIKGKIVTKEGNFMLLR